MIVVARFFMDFSVELTAEVAGCAEGTVRAATHQAIANLRASGLVVADDLQEAT